MLLIANVIFFVGSLICGVAVNIKMLIAGRVIQGVGGGGLLSLVNICIGDLFSQRFVIVFSKEKILSLTRHLGHEACTTVLLG